MLLSPSLPSSLESLWESQSSASSLLDRLGGGGGAAIPVADEVPIWANDGLPLLGESSGFLLSCIFSFVKYATRALASGWLTRADGRYIYSCRSLAVFSYARGRDTTPTDCRFPIYGNVDRFFLPSSCRRPGFLGDTRPTRVFRPTKEDDNGSLHAGGRYWILSVPVHTHCAGDGRDCPNKKELLLFVGKVADVGRARARR